MRDVRCRASPSLSAVWYTDLQVKPGYKVPDVTIDFGFNVSASLARAAPCPPSLLLSLLTRSYRAAADYAGQHRGALCQGQADFARIAGRLHSVLIGRSGPVRFKYFLLPCLSASSFTQTAPTRPRGYLAAEDKLKAAGVEEVLVYCVNDGAVMAGWAKDQGVEGSIVTFLADTRAELTKALGMEMTHPGPMEALGNLRCKRHAAIVVDGVITAFNVSEAEGDPGE